MSPSPSPTSPSRVGRPRAKGVSASSTESGRDQILDAAAALFSEFGFAGTSTRAIADRVGIRQQSLYYYFSGKDELLQELLTSSVRPSIDFIEGVEAKVPDHVSPAAALFALATVDARTLRSTPHNIGTLYLLPEIQDARYETFRAERSRLRAIYGRLGSAAAHPDVRSSVDEALLGSILIHLTEVVIQLRRDNESAPLGTDDEIVAASCLRVIGLTTEQIDEARSEASAVIASETERKTSASAD